jgi:predicted S18 family serine protease
MITTSRKITSLVFSLGLLLLLSNCVSAPVQEMSDARQAIQAAKEAGANSSGQSSLGKAEALLKEAEASLENGEYKKARVTAVKARDEALQAQKDASETSSP